MIVNRTSLSDSSVLVKITINTSDNNLNYHFDNLVAELSFKGDIMCNFFSAGNSDYHEFSGRGHDNKISTSTFPSSDNYCDIVLVLNNVADETIDLDLTYDICGRGLYLLNTTESVTQKISFPAI